MEEVWNLMSDKKHKEIHSNLMSFLDRVERNINLDMTFPDVMSHNFKFKLREWVLLPKEVAKGVSTMGLHLEDDYRSCIVHYEKNAYIDPHLHSKEIEVIRVLEGEIYDKFSGRNYKEGEIMTIEKGVKHHIISKKMKEAYLHIVFSEKEKVIEELFKKNYM